LVKDKEKSNYFIYGMENICGKSWSNFMGLLFGVE
jgi:hypothetical protein